MWLHDGYFAKPAQRDGSTQTVVLEIAKLRNLKGDAFISHIISHITSVTLLGLLTRWLTSVKHIKIKFISASAVQCVWRRIQVNHQQGERQKKSILQKALSFNARAVQIMGEDWTRPKT